MRSALALSILALTVACGKLTTTGTPDFATFYGRSLVHEAAQDAAIALVVHGRPSPHLSQADASRLIADSVQLPGWFPPTRLRPATGGERYRVVMIFNPVSIAQAANHPCEPLTSMATGNGAGGTVVVGAFCAGERAASENRGEAPAIEQRGDTLLALARQLVTSLFPPANPLLRDDRDDRRPRWLFGG